MQDNNLDGFDSITFKKFLEKYSELMTNYSTHTVCISSLLCAMLKDSQPYNEIYVTSLDNNRPLNESMDILWDDMSKLYIKPPQYTQLASNDNDNDTDNNNDYDTTSLTDNYTSSNNVTISNSTRPDLVISEIRNYKITTEMITNFLNELSTDVEMATEELNQYIEQKLTPLSVYCNLDTYNESVRIKAYKEIIYGILEFINAKYIFFQNITNLYRPFSIYSNRDHLLNDNCRLSNYLRDASLKWITLNNLTKNLRPPFIVMNPSHIKYLKLESLCNVKLNKNVKYEILTNYQHLIKLYCEALTHHSVSLLMNIDIPSCFHIYPSLINNLLMGSCDYDTRIMATNIGNGMLDIENPQMLTSIIYNEASLDPWRIDNKLIPSELDPSRIAKNTILKLDCIYNMIASATKSTNCNILLDEQNIVVKQLAALLCPSITYYTSKIALLLLIGNNSIVECTNYSLSSSCNNTTNTSNRFTSIDPTAATTTTPCNNPEYKEYIPTLSTILNSIDLQVPLLWNIIPKKSIIKKFKNINNNSPPPIATIKTIFRLSIDIDDLFKTHFYLLAKVNVKILSINKDQTLRIPTMLFRKISKILKGELSDW